jgi:hypothetical protein
MKYKAQYGLQILQWSIHLIQYKQNIILSLCSVMEVIYRWLAMCMYKHVCLWPPASHLVAPTSAFLQNSLQLTMTEHYVTFLYTQSDRPGYQQNCKSNKSTSRRMRDGKLRTVYLKTLWLPKLFNNTINVHISCLLTLPVIKVVALQLGHVSFKWWNIFHSYAPLCSYF